MIVAIVQARMGSTRLPGKVLMDLGGQPLLQVMLNRVRRIVGVDRVILATTLRTEDDALCDFGDKLGVGVYRGAESDVLHRIYHAARAIGAQVVMRLTGDCPLIDPAVSAEVLRSFCLWRNRPQEAFHYVSNVHPPVYPDGLDTEVLSIETLAAAYREATAPDDREHVTSFVWKRPERFRCLGMSATGDLSQYRWTVDTAQDLDHVRQLVAIAGPHADLPAYLKAEVALTAHV